MDQIDEILENLITAIKESKEYQEYLRLENEFAPLRAEPYVNEYLAAELAICRMIQRINFRLMEEIEFDLGFEH